MKPALNNAVSRLVFWWQGAYIGVITFSGMALDGRGEWASGPLFLFGGLDGSRFGALLGLGIFPVGTSWT